MSQQPPLSQESVIVRPHSQTSPRPPFPAQNLCKRGPSFRFPKTLLHWAIAPVSNLHNHGKLGNTPAKCHVVMCGFPRTGTTLMNLIVHNCVTGVQAYLKEIEGMNVARYAFKNKEILCTKRPNDVFMVEDLIKFYASLETDVRFLLFVRDPRDVLTSVHSGRPGEYYVSVARWRAIWDHWHWASTLPEALVIPFEQLTSDIDTVERLTIEHIGWNVAHPFRLYHEKSLPDGFQTVALNGFRPLDQSSRQRWRNPKYHQRICELLDEMPELPQRLIDLGYEKDTAWASDFQSVRKAA